MRNIWGTLIWKEWHEQRWRLASLTTILMGVPVYAYLNHLPADETFSVCSTLLVLYGVPAALFIAMDAAARERADRTLDFVRALPADLWKIALVKLFAGAVTVALPILVMALWMAGWIWKGGLDGVNFSDFGLYAPTTDALARKVVEWGLIAAGSATSVFLWSTAAGMKQPTELRAGLAGLVILAAWGILVVFIAMLLPMDFGSREYEPAVVAAWFSPAGLLMLLGGSPAGLVVVLQLLVHVKLVTWILPRFGSVLAADDRSPIERKGEPDSYRLGLEPPRRYPISAMAWMQWREALPLAAAGPVIIAGLTALMAGIVHWGRGDNSYTGLISVIVGTFSGATIPIGILVALVIGVGTFAPDLQPRLFTFWRSRPIEPSLWFWMKFFVGAAAIFLFLYAPVLVLGLLAADLGAGAQGVGLGYLGCIPLLLLLTYALAVCLTCIVRHSIYAGILALMFSLGILLGGRLIADGDPRLAWLDLFEVMNHIDAYPPGWNGADALSLYLRFALTLAGLSFVAVMLAWSSVRFDLGKSLRLSRER